MAAGAAHMRKVEGGRGQRAKGDEADRLPQPLVAQPAAAAQRPAQLPSVQHVPVMNATEAHERCPMLTAVFCTWDTM